MGTSFEDLPSALAAVTAGVCQETKPKATTTKITTTTTRTTTTTTIAKAQATTKKITTTTTTATATDDVCEYGLVPGPDGPTDKALNLCTGKSVIDFTASMVVENNLGGSGPSSGPEHIRYATVATVQGHSLDLLVSTTSPGYTPFSASNGQHGGMGLISMKSGAKVDLKFQFVDSDSPRTVESFTFAFLDFDQWLFGKGGVECIKI